MTETRISRLSRHAAHYVVKCTDPQGQGARLGAKKGCGHHYAFTSKLRPFLATAKSGMVKRNWQASPCPKCGRRPSMIGNDGLRFQERAEAQEEADYRNGGVTNGS